MKNIITYLFTVLISFLFGGLATYLVMTKQQMDAVLSVKHANKRILNNTNQEISTANGVTTKSDKADELGKLADLAKNKEDLSLNDYSEDQAKKLIENMPDYVLSQYVDMFMAADANNAIGNKRRFAERAIEELYRPNDNKQLTGTAKVSFSYVMPEESDDTSEVTKFQKIYAHIDTHGKVPANKFVFIKWVNNQTGQVLLFDKKSISTNSNKNWVSYIPNEGWEVGSYDIRFYQFNSELQPIAQTTYNIYKINDENTKSETIIHPQ